MTGSFRQGGIPQNGGLQGLLGEELFDFACHIVAQVCFRAVKSQDQPLKFDGALQFLFCLTDPRQYLGKALHGEVLTLDRNQDRVCQSQSQIGHGTEAGGAIEDDVIEGGLITRPGFPEEFYSRTPGLAFIDRNLQMKRAGEAAEAIDGGGPACSFP